MRNDRWSTTREIKDRLNHSEKTEKGGPVLYHNNGQNWVYDDTGHLIFLGVTGCGKSRRGTIPMVRNLIEKEESFIAVDPKGEIHLHTAHYLSPNYDKHVIDFRHIFESECINLLAAPMELYRSGDPVKKQIAIEMIDNMSFSIFPTVEKDPFWSDTARTLFCGIVYALMEIAKPEEINLASVYTFAAKGDERFGGSSFLKEIVSMLPVDSIAAGQLQDYVGCNATETRAGVLSTFKQGMSKFVKSEGLISMMGSDDLHINQLDAAAPTAIYIVIPDETPIYNSICTVLIGQLMSHYIRLAQDKYNGTLPRRVNFLVEEAGNIGRIGCLGDMLAAGRSRGVRCQLVLQNYSQLDTLYGAAEAATIRSNADNLVAFRTNHWETLSELSNMCGEREVEKNNRFSQEKLITPSQLAAMETGQALVMLAGRTKYITWLPDYTEMFDCTGWKAPKRIMKRRDADVRMFDIQQYVKDMKRQKMEQMLAAAPRTTAQERPSLFAPPLPRRPFKENVDRDDEPSFNIDEMIKSIDKKIAELEAQEKAEKEEQS